MLCQALVLMSFMITLVLLVLVYIDYHCLIDYRDTKSKIRNVESMEVKMYETTMNRIVEGATPLDTANVQDCIHGKGLGFYIPKTTEYVFIPNCINFDSIVICAH